jgi:hypothetical protein
MGAPQLHVRARFLLPRRQLHQRHALPAGILLSVWQHAAHAVRLLGVLWPGFHP